MKRSDWYKKINEIKGTPQSDQLLYMVQMLDASDKAYSAYRRKIEKWMQNVYEFGKHVAEEDAKKEKPHFDTCWNMDWIGRRYWAVRCSECHSSFPAEITSGWAYCPKCGVKIREAKG